MAPPLAVTALACLLALPLAPEAVGPAPAVIGVPITRPVPGPPTVEQLLRQAAARHGISPNWLLRAAWCESRWNPGAVSRNGLYHGLMQFSWGTWAWMSRAAGWAGASPYDARAAAEVAAWALSMGYASHWPSCA